MLYTNLTLVGALTSKPYAFLARSWELKNIETIDLFDSLCSNIRIDIKGSQIMRVLPINNTYINEEWITDKTRFAYDAFKRWRFIKPMIKKNNIFVETSWETAFSFIKNKVLLNKYNDIIINTGNFTDLEHITALKSLTDKLDNVIINNNINKNCDLQNYFISSENVHNIITNKVIILVGTNLRIENPILNIKLRKLAQSSNLLIAYIGAKYDSNIDFYHLGTDINILKKLLKGKHPWVNIIQSFLKKNNQNIKIPNIFKSKISVIIGSECSNMNLTPFIKNSLFDFEFLIKSSGELNALELGFLNNRKFNNKVSNLFYLLGSDNVKAIKNTDFVIYQGHHNDVIRTKCDVILPSVTWTEKVNLYLNCFGIVQKTNFVNLPPINARTDWKITKMFSNLLETNIPFENIKQIHNRLNQLSPNILLSLSKYKHGRNIKLDFNKHNYQFNNFHLQKNPFKTRINSYFLSNSLERASKIMTTCYNNFDKKNNF